MYVVDLRRADYYQKCHDPDCQGYRSPLRPIPWNVIPDPPYSYDSVQLVDQIGSTNDNLKLQHFSNGCEHFLLCDDKHDPDSCSKDSWWLEAIKVAEVIENKQKTSLFLSFVTLLKQILIFLVKCSKHYFYVPLIIVSCLDGTRIMPGIRDMPLEKLYGRHVAEKYSRN
ncbi:hypothetical protein OIU76_021987 [Salix suchowensis]|nr:hypothetical protein OIU76_021987 [Salix suchowensis]